MSDRRLTRSDSAGLREDTQVAIAHMLSQTFQSGASVCAASALSIELSCGVPGKAPGQVSEEHRSAVMLSIIASAAYLESTVNELLGLTHDRFKATLAPDYRGPDWNPPAASGVAMARWWAKDGRRANIREKYRALYRCCGRSLHLGADPAQAAFDVVDLRDSFIHYHPHWNTEGGEQHEMESQLRARNLGRNPLVTGDTWPLSYLSAATADWALGSAGALVDEATALHAAALTQPER